MAVKSTLLPHIVWVQYFPGLPELTGKQKQYLQFINKMSNLVSDQQFKMRTTVKLPFDVFYWRENGTQFAPSINRY